MELLAAAPAPQAWESVQRDLSSLVADLSGALKTYAYTEDAAKATDEQLAGWLMAQLRAAKHRLLPAMDRAFALAGRTAAPGYHQFEHAATLLRDDLDIFSDEVKLRSFSWSSLEPDWLKMLVRKDHELLQGARKLVAAVERLDADLGKADAAVLAADPGFWPALAAPVGKARQQLSELVRTFKERDNICNLKKFEFSKTLAQIQRAAR